MISHWLFPQPVTQPILHNGNVIGEVRLTARDSVISHFIYLSLAVLTGCILLASGIALMLTRYLHNGVVEALQNITEVVHDVRTNRNFSRRVSEERIEEFHLLPVILIACWTRWRNGNFGCRQRTLSFCAPRYMIL